MKVCVLAAGKGTRMLPFTKKTPKPLIHINKKPFIDYTISNIKTAGFHDIVLVVGYLKEKLINHLGPYFTYVIQEEQKGTAHAVSLLQDIVNSNFIVIMGDNIYSPYDIKSIAQQDDYCYVACLTHPEPQKFGMVISKDGFLKRIIEKPKNPTTNLISAGLYKFTPEIFGAIKKIKPSERGELEITDAISLLAQKNKVKLMKIKDYWINLGSIEDIPVVEKQLRSLNAHAVA